MQQNHKTCAFTPKDLKISQQRFPIKFSALRGLTCAILHTADPSLTDENIHCFYVLKKLEISLNPLRTLLVANYRLHNPHVPSHSIKGNCYKSTPKHALCSAIQEHQMLDRSDETVLQKFGEKNLVSQRVKLGL